MRDKWFVVLVSLGIGLTLLLSSDTYGANSFYYGTWHYEGQFWMYPTFKDTLKFNMVVTCINDEWKADTLAKYGIRAVSMSPAWENDTPDHWATYSYYTLWEAEGNPNVCTNLIHPEGGEVSDPDASGGRAWRVSSNHEAPGLIQRGPGCLPDSAYWQEAKYFNSADQVPYSAGFRLKLIGSLPDTTRICKLMIDADSDIIKDSILVKSQFTPNQYGQFILNYSLDQDHPVQFKIYWYGEGDLCIDYVKVSDPNGRELISGNHDAEIIAYIDAPWAHTQIPETGETVIHRWYMRDEPNSIDCHYPYAYIDTILMEHSIHEQGMQAFCHFNSLSATREYLLWENPKELHVDPYPVGMFGDNYSGTYFQSRVNILTDWLNNSRGVSLDYNKELWVTIQTFAWGMPDTGGCPNYLRLIYNDTVYCLWCREPTPFELRLQTYLALSYGANAIMNWKYFYDVHSDGLLLTGLYDQRANPESTTAKWREIRDFIGPRMKVLGAIYAPLEWQGACLDDVVNSFVLRNGQPSYLDSIRSPGDEPHWVQVGFFEDSTGDTSYFMLVNRECLKNEGANYDVFVTKTGGPYRIREMYTNSVIDTVNGVGDYFTVYFGPGEGKLFRLEEFFVSPHIKKVPKDYATIQAAIDASTDGDTVLVAPGSYLENINFKGKKILVGSFYIFDQDTATISHTIIDGSSPSHPDSGSVVRFISGEDSTSILKGFTITGGTGTAWNGPGRALRQGGGIYCSNSSPTIINNLIIDNYIPGAPGGARWEMGGGIGCWGASSPLIVNNLILNNSCGDGGAGIGLYYSGSPIIVNNTLSNNSGDGICVVDNCDFTATNNIIVNNDSYGISFVNCPYYVYGVSYNDVWNNAGGNFNDEGYPPPEIGDTTWGKNYNGTPCDTFYNIIRDPLFVDPGNNNFYLQESSPCIDAGDPISCPPFKSGCRVDMGAFEFDKGYICGDVDGNGRIDLADCIYLARYILQGGPAPVPIEAGEINCQVRINLADVIYLAIYLLKGGKLPCCPY